MKGGVCVFRVGIYIDSCNYVCLVWGFVYVVANLNELKLKQYPGGARGAPYTPPFAGGESERPGPCE